jgi:hypothetical protein
MFTLKKKMSLASSTGNMDHGFPALSIQNRFQVLDQARNGVKYIFQKGESEWANKKLQKT